EPAQRIGLSATVRPHQEVARFLGGGRPVTIVAPPSEKAFDLRVVVPVEDMTALADRTDGEIAFGLPPPPGVGPDEPVVAPIARRGPAAEPAETGLRGLERRGSIWPYVEERLVELIRGHRSTIVFVNSRRMAE